MKKLLFNLIIFSIPLIITVISLDLYLKKKNTLYKEKLKAIELNKDNVEILILGNSHAAFAVDPQYFDYNAYNLASVSQSIYFDRRLTEKYLNKLNQLKFVFISIDYHSLNFSSQGIRDYWSYYAHGIKYKNKSYFKEEISPFLFSYKTKVTISLLRDDLKNMIFNKQPVIFMLKKGVCSTDSIYNGYIGFTGTDEIMFNKNTFKRKATSFNNGFKNTSERKFVINDLRTFIENLKEQNVTPILFSSPTYSDYNTFLSKKNIKKNEIVINEICSDYNIEYWNYSNNPSFEKEYFYNQDHMNKNGAEKFSIILNKRIKDYEKARTDNTVYKK